MKIDARYVISMMDFLVNYLHIENVDDVLNQINHRDITELNIDGVKRVPSQLVKNSDVVKGRVLWVESTGAKHKGKEINAYMRPDLVKKEDNLSDLDKMINKALYEGDTPLFINERKYSNKVDFKKAILIAFLFFLC